MAAESSEPEFSPGLSGSHSLARAGLAPSQRPDKGRSPKQDRIRVRAAAEGDVVGRLAAFLAASSTLNPAAGVGPAADRAHLLEEAAIALGAQRAAVIAAAPNEPCLCWAAYGLTPAQTQEFLTREWGSPPAVAPGSANPLRISPVNRISDILEEEFPDSPLVRAEQIQLAGPGTEPCGWLLLDRAPIDEGPRSEEQMLTMVVADRLARAVHNHGQRERAAPNAAGIARERRLLKGLLEAGASIHEALNLDQVLQRVAELLAESARFEAVAIYILEAETQTLRPTAIVGVSAEEQARMRAVPIALKDFAPLLRPSMRRGRSYLFDHRRHKLPAGSVLDTALAVPAMPPRWRPGQWHPLDSLTIPMELTKGQLLGLISLDRPQGRRFPANDELRALELFADQCAAAISRAQIYRYMEELALTDSLTGLHNRHALEQTLTQDLARIARRPAPYSVLFCDLDHLKEVNDSLGHSVGDQVLQQVAAVLRQRLRRGDFAARWGGDEFVVLLPDTTARQAWGVADDLRRRVITAPTAMPVSASIGIANPPEGELDARAVLERADAAMYLAKRAGRNRVAGPEPDDLGRPPGGERRRRLQ